MSYLGGGMIACTIAFSVPAGQPLLASSMPIERPSREWSRACKTSPSALAAGQVRCTDGVQRVLADRERLRVDATVPSGATSVRSSEMNAACG